MKPADITAAFVSINARAAAIAARAMTGAGLDELIAERDALHDAIIALLIKVHPRREIIDAHALRRTLNDLTGASVPFVHRFAVVRNAVNAIARLEQGLITLVGQAA